MIKNGDKPHDEKLKRAVLQQVEVEQQLASKGLQQKRAKITHPPSHFCDIL